MKILVVGAGEVGTYSCKVLSEQQHDVTVLEQSEAVASSIDEAHNVRVIRCNGSSAQVLTQADVGDCDAFLAMTSDDRTNLVSCSLAKVLGTKLTIARVHDQMYTDNSYVNYQVHFGIDVMLNPEALCAVELAKEIRNPGRVAVENFARGEIEVQQICATSRSRFIGKPLKELNLIPNVRIGYVQRGNQLEIPSSETVIKEGDSLTLFGTPEALFEIKPKLDPNTAVGSVRVVLFGGEETAVALARLLSNSRFKIRIIDKEPRRCRRLAEHFPGITVIHGDATSLRLLEEEQIGNTDYFVPCTKDDEINIMTSLQAAKLGAHHVKLVINKPDYEAVLNELKDVLGVETVLSPRIATVNEILRYLSTDPYIELATLPDQNGKILEIYIPPDSNCNGKKIKDIMLPRDSLIVALLHKYHAKIPHMDDTILSGDRVVAIVKHEGDINPLVETLT